jgi:cytochrome c553
MTKVCGVTRRRSITVRNALAALAVGVSGPLAAQGTGMDTARNLAGACAGCHGTNGLSAGTIASLAGQSREDLVARMQEFKTGKRSGTVMPQLAKGYTDEQIDLIAGWLAAQRPAK